MSMKDLLKISHHKHSGKLRPHEHTSYLPLLILLLMTSFPLTVYSVDALSPPPQSESVSLTGSMPGPAPTVAAVITSPTNQQHFSASPVTVTGTCPAKTLVEIYKNDIFGGSGSCSSTGYFSFDVDLLIGQNVLVARVYNSLNEPGPDSAHVLIFYDALPQQSAALAPLNFGGAQMILNTDAVFRGTFPNQQLSVPVTIIGGTPPYAVNMQWGDTSNNVVPRNDSLNFDVGHVYQKAGTYQITLQATDTAGRVAFLTVAAIVNGQPSAVAATTSIGSVNNLLVLWPLYTSATAVVISFWLGERREKHIFATVAVPTQPRS